MKVPTSALLLSFAVGSMAFTGCAVPQPAGRGTVSREVEPGMQAGYWLYLPDDYVNKHGRRSSNESWPVVVTFHGTKPFDNANPQVREWQQEADRYGFIVIAPELRTCDIFMQFPLTNPNLSYVQRDEKATLAIMDRVFSETSADPKRVLCTGWSTGGYMAHFMANRHPDKFSCLAVRESPFSEQMLNPARTGEYRDMRVAIFFGENDFPVCRAGSAQAVRWYRKHGFTVDAKCVIGAGHERIPQYVAAFYAASIGVAPKTPPNLARGMIKDVVSDSDE